METDAARSRARSTEESGAEPDPVLLIIDGGHLVGDALVAGLETEGFHVLVAGTGEEGLSLCLGQHPDVVLVGTDLPDLPSRTVLRVLSEMERMPIIAMAHTDDEDEAVRALEMGAVDFLVPPMRVRECAARIRSALRIRLIDAPPSRAALPTSPLDWSRHLAAGPVHVDLDRREVTVRGLPVHTRPKELVLLALLVSRAERVVTREQAFAVVWPGSTERDKSLDVYIRRLRRLVEPDFNRPRHIITLRGFGHRFDP